jgi:hypothetical protein
MKRTAIGATAGVVGTMALQASRSAADKWIPGATPPMTDPAEYMTERAKRALPPSAQRAVSGKPQHAAAWGLGLMYGMLFGAIYADLRPRGGRSWIDGIILGLGVWAIGYLGWLPGAKLMPPIWKQSAKQATAPAAHHALYGMATVAVYDWLADKL